MQSLNQPTSCVNSTSQGTTKRKIATSDEIFRDGQLTYTKDQMTALVAIVQGTDQTIVDGNEDQPDLENSTSFINDFNCYCNNQHKIADKTVFQPSYVEIEIAESTSKTQFAEICAIISCINKTTKADEMYLLVCWLKPAAKNRDDHFQFPQFEYEGKMSALRKRYLVLSIVKANTVVKPCFVIPNVRKGCRLLLKLLIC